MKRMKFKTLNTFMLICFSLTIGFSACSDDDDDDSTAPVGVDKGNIFPNRVTFRLINKSDSTMDSTYVLYDPDGVGGANPVQEDTIVFPLGINSQTAFFAELGFFKDGIDYTSQIRALGTKYRICYRDFNFFDLALDNSDMDGNGALLGINTEWLAKRKINAGTIRITMNYNQQPKDGSCNAGSLVYENYFPFKIE